MNVYNLGNFKNNKKEEKYTNTATQKIKRKDGFCKLLLPMWGTIPVTPSLRVKSPGCCLESLG